jgi:hypothetical protein
LPRDAAPGSLLMPAVDGALGSYGSGGGFGGGFDGDGGFGGGMPDVVPGFGDGFDGTEEGGLMMDDEFHDFSATSPALARR